MCLFDKRNLLRKNVLQKANGQASLQVEGIGEMGICDVKFCAGTSADLISVSKLTLINLEIGLGNIERPVSLVVNRPTRSVVLALISISYFDHGGQLF